MNSSAPRVMRYISVPTGTGIGSVKYSATRRASDDVKPIPVNGGLARQSPPFSGEYGIW